MASLEPLRDDRDRRLDEVIAEYLRLQAAGQTPERAQWLAQFPDLSDELGEFFDGASQVKAVLQRAPGPLVPANAAPAADPTHVEQAIKPTVTGLPREAIPYESGITPGKFAVGARIDTYELLQKLGEGGMGAVWKARHTKLDKLVALKVLPPHLTSDAATVRRFEREMRAVGKVEHPHVVRALDAGEVGGLHFLVMEYVEGVDLLTHIRTRGPRSLVDACRMARQAALGLAASHSQGLIHRDIKPSNLLLTRQGQVKVLDLGLARLMDDDRESAQLTRMGQVLGTPDYMAPEQWGDTHAVDHRADLYALGCTLFFLLTGRAPYGDDGHSTIGEKMKGHLLEPIPRLRDLRPDVTEELDSLYCRLLAKDPAQRMASAAEVAQRLKDITQQLSTPSVPPQGAGQRVPGSGVAPDRPEVAPERLLLESCGRSASPAAAPPVEGGVRPAMRGSVPPPNRRWPSMLAAAGGAAAVLALLGVTVIRVIQKDGKATEWTVPDGVSSVEVQRDGKTVAKVSVADAAATAPSTRHPSQGPAAAAPALAIAPFDQGRARQHQESWAQHLGVPVEFTNSIGMKFRLIPPGEFMMGMTQQEAEAVARHPGDEVWRRTVLRSVPQNRERIAGAFYLGVYEVTQQQYERVMNANPAFFSAAGQFKNRVAGGNVGQHPVESVNFAMASEFCNKLSSQEMLKPAYVRANESISFVTGEGYRLPTEAEWEWACRAGTTTAWFCGDQESELATVAWYGGNSGDKTHPVGQLKSNPFGLYDVHGNVWEWCHESHAPQTYSIGPLAPAAERDLIAVRGGRWSGTSATCRSALHEASFDANRHSYNTGLRLAVGLSASRSNR